MKQITLLTTLLYLITNSVAELAPSSSKVQNYYKALESRPLNEQLFSRFYEAWTLEGETGDLGAFLQSDDSWQAQVLLARYQNRMGNRTEAISALTQALESAPEKAPLQMMRAQMAMQDFDFDAAIKDLETLEFTVGSEESLQSTRLLGTCYLRTQQVDKALELWTAAISTTDAGLDFVEAAAVEGEYEKAASLCNKLIETTKDPYEKTRYQVRHAELLGLSGKSEEALESLQQTIDNTGTGSWLETETLRTADLILSRQGDAPAEVAYYLALTKLYPQRTEIKRNYAHLLAIHDDWEQANALFQEILQTNPEDATLRQDYIRLLTIGGQDGKALDELNLLIEQSGDDSALLIQKMDLLQNLERKDEIEPLIEQLATKLGDSESEQLELAELYLKYRYAEKGEAILVKIAGIEGNQLAQETLATHYLKQEKKEQALQLLIKIAEQGDLDTLNRTTRKIAIAGQQEQAFDIHVARKGEFSTDFSYLASLCQLGLGAKRYNEVEPAALDLVHLSSGQVDLKEAIKMALKIIERAETTDDHIEQLQNATSTQDKCLLAALYHTQDQFEQAEQTLAAGVQHKEPIQTMYWVDLLVGRKELDRANEVLSSMLDTPTGKTVQFLRQLTTIQENIAEYDQALQTVARWKEVSPNDKLAWLRESKLLYEEGRSDESIQCLQRAAARFENADDIQTKLSQQYVYAGRYQDSLDLLWKNFENAQSVDQKLRWSQQLVKVSNITGELEGLKAEFKRRRQANTKELAPIIALAKIATQEGDHDAERLYLEQALDLQPKNTNLLSLLGDSCESLGDLKAAENTYLQALEYSDSKNAGKELLRFYFRIGEEAKALARLRPAINFDDLEEIETLAFEMYEIGFIESAIELLAEVVAMNPQDWRLRYHYGCFLEDNRQYELAAEQFMEIESASGELAWVTPTENAPDYAEMTRAEAWALHVGAYSHVPIPNHNNGEPQLPESPAMVKLLAQAHLYGIMYVEGHGALSDKITEHLIGRGHQEVDVLKKLAYRQGLNRRTWGSTSYVSELLEQYPESEFLMECSMQYGLVLKLKQAQVILARYTETTPAKCYAALSILSQSEDAAELQAAGQVLIDAFQSDLVLTASCWFRFFALPVNELPEGLSEDEMRPIRDAFTQYYDRHQGIPGDEKHSLDSRLQTYFFARQDETRLIPLLNTPPAKESLPQHAQNRNYENFIYQPVVQLFNWNGSSSETTIALPDSELRDDGESYKSDFVEFVRRVIPQVDSPLSRAQLHQALKEDELRHAALELALEQGGKAQVEALKKLAKIAYNKKDLAAAMQYIIDYEKRVQVPMRRAIGQSLLTQIAAGLSTEQRKPYLAKVTQTLSGMYQAASPGNYSRHKLQELAQQMQIKLRPSKLTKENQEKRSSLIAGLTYTGLDQQYRRIEPLVQAGKQQKATRLAIYLLHYYLRVPHSYYPDEYAKLVKLIKKQGLTEGVLAGFRQGTDLSSLKSDNYIAVAYLLGRQTEAKQALERHRDPRAAPGHHALSQAMLLYPEEPEKAVGVLIKSYREHGMESLTRAPSFTTHTKPVWRRNHGLMSAFLAELVKEELDEEVDLSRFLSLINDCISHRSFVSTGNLNYYAGILNGHSNDESLKQELTDNTVSICNSLRSHPSTSVIALRVQLLLAKNAMAEKVDLPAALREIILNGALTVGASEVQGYNMHYVNRALQEEGVSLATPLYQQIKGEGFDKIFPKEFMTQLQAEDEKGHQILLEIKALSQSKGDDFELKQKALSKTLTKKTSSLCVEFASELSYLAPYTKEQMDADLAELRTRLTENQLYYNNRSELVTEAVRVYDQTSQDLTADDLSTFVLSIAEASLGKRETWQDKHNVSYNSSMRIRTFSEFLQITSKRSEGLSDLLKTLWQYEIPSWGLTYDLGNRIGTREYQDAADAVSYLKALGQVTNASDYFPLYIRSSERNNIYQLQQTVNIYENLTQYRGGNDKKFWREVSQLLVKEKEGRFGALITAALLTDDSGQQQKLIDQAFTEHAKELVALPDWHLEALFFVTEKIYTPGEVEDPALRKLVEKSGQVRLEKLHAESDKFIAELKSGAAYKGQNSTHETYYRTYNLIVQYLYHDLEKAVEVFTTYEAGYTKQRLQGGYYSFYNNPNSIVSSASDELLANFTQQGGDNLRGLQFVGKVLESREVRERLSVDSLVHRLEAPLTQALGKIKFSKEWRKLDQFAQSQAEASAGIRAILAASVIQKFDDIGKWDLSADDKIIKGWQARAEAGDSLYQAMMVIAHYRCQADNDQVRRKRLIPSLLTYCANEQVHTNFRIYAILDAVDRDDDLAQNEQVLNALIALNTSHLNGKRSARTRLQQAVCRIASKAPPALAKKVLDTWVEAAKKPLRGEERLIPSSLSKCVIRVCNTAQDFETLGWLLRYAGGDNVRGEIPILISLLNAGQYETVKQLLPPKGQTYKDWYATEGYTNKLQQSIVAMREQGLTPLESFRMESFLLWHKIDFDDKPEETLNQRATRLCKEFKALEKPKGNVYLEALRNLTSTEVGRRLMRTEVAELMHEESFDDLLSAQANNNDKVLTWKVQLYLVYAVNEMQTGNLNPLQDCIKTLVLDADDWQRGMHIIKLYEYLCLPILDLIQSGQKTELYQPLYDLMKEAVLGALKSGATNNRVRARPLFYAKLLAHELNCWEDLPKWDQELKAGQKKAYRSITSWTALTTYASWTLWDTSRGAWLEDDNKERRIALYRWIYRHPYTANSSVGNSYSIEYPIFKGSAGGLKPEEAFDFLEDPNISQTVKTNLHLAKAKWHVKNKEHAEAIPHYDNALATMDGEKWDGLYDNTTLSYVGALINLDRQDTAKARLKTLRWRKASKAQIKRRNGMHQKLGIPRI